MKYKLITAALPYANGDLHLGHIAGCYLNADIRNRFEKMLGTPTVFISGSDAYGSAILMHANKTARKAEDIVKLYHDRHKNLFKSLDIEFDIFSSTMTDIHKDTVIDFFDKLFKQDCVEEREGEQLFDDVRKEFLADRFIQGECPFCGYKKARGDECSSCGKVFETNELISPISAIFKNPLILKKTKHFYIKMHAWRSSVERMIKERSWKSSVKTIAKAFVKNLQDRCITRSIPWGVKVPSEYKSKDSSADVFYVWFDAPIGYMSITKEYFRNTNELSTWEDLWFGGKAEIINFMGKDNAMFHTVMFPCMELMAFEEKINIVDEVCCNNFLLLNDMKFSKSDGNSIDIYKLIDIFGKDGLRFYVALNAPDSSDVSCSISSIKNDINTIFIGKIGNFVNRVLKFVENKVGAENIKWQDVKDGVLYSQIKKSSEFIKDNFKVSSVRNAMNGIRDFADILNRYFDENKPWALVKKEGAEMLNEVMINCLYGIKALAVFLNPVTPNISKRIFSMIGNVCSISSDIFDWNECLEICERDRYCFGEVNILMKRIDDA